MATIKSVEEKAKAYDEAKINGSRLWECGEITRESYEYIFPELKESEDEKVRKWLIGYLENRILNCSLIDEKENCKTAVAWLEKQGKNNMGISEATKQKLEDNLNKALEKETPESWNDFLDEQKSADKVEPKFHVGDIVKSKSQPMLIPRKIISIGKDCYWCEDRGCIGFAWEDDCELVEQKPAWSENDETALGDALWCCKQAASIAKDENDMGNAWYAENWLKSLKDRVQPKQEWSKEDERMFKNTIALIETLEDCNKAPDGFGDVKFWLESLKERYTWKPSDEQMHYLSWIANVKLGDSVVEQEVSKHLNELYEDLLKLKG